MVEVEKNNEKREKGVMKKKGAMGLDIQGIRISARSEDVQN